MKGMFIVLEGIDGCGKSTQIKHLSTWLSNSKIIPKDSKLLITREPGGTKIGTSLRNLLLNDLNYSPQPLTELLLYAADRAQHVSELILPAINNGDWVLSDRFSSSTMAYQGFGRKLNQTIIKQLEDIASQGIKPNLTILLDISVDESIKRRHRKKEDRIESEGKDFLACVAEGFQSIAKDEGWMIIPADESEEIVKENIKKKLINFLKR